MSSLFAPRLHWPSSLPPLYSFFTKPSRGLSPCHCIVTRWPHSYASGLRNPRLQCNVTELSVRLYGTGADSTSLHPSSKNSEAESSPPIPRHRGRLIAYQNALANGFKGTRVEFEIEAHRQQRKFPEAAPSITTLRLEEALSRNQFIITNPGHPSDRTNCWKGQVLFNGESLGKVSFYRGHTLPALPMDEDVCLYMLPKDFILRLRKRDGSDHPNQIDVRDFIHRMWCRTLADLAARQGLIEPFTSDGYIKSFGFKANVKAQYRMLFKYTAKKRFFGFLRYAPEIRAEKIYFRVDEADLPDSPSRTIKGFFYIDRGGMMRFWDVERERDLVWRATPKKTGLSDAWSAEAIRRRYPGLWAHAVRLGHWQAD